LKQTLALGGDWELTGFDRDGTRKASLPERVPGHVHPDLQRAGLIADPFWRDQADLCQWVEHCAWRYTREFNVPPAFIQPWTLLCFDGLDTFATIYLNGRPLGQTANMFIPRNYSGQCISG
jgi:beta-mannosidase